MTLPVSFPFDPDTATEVAARFIQLEGGSINVLKSVKLMSCAGFTTIFHSR